MKLFEEPVMEVQSFSTEEILNGISGDMGETDWE